MLLSQDWYRFFQSQEWDAVLLRWHLRQFPYPESDLGVVNRHPEDHWISFIGTGGLHQYTLTRWFPPAATAAGRFTRRVTQSKLWPLFVSCTTSTAPFKKPFDADAIIDAMMARKNWSRSKYYGQTKEQIKAGWEANRDAQSAKGTATHANIEDMCNGRPHDRTTKEFAMVRRFFDECLSTAVECYRTEWMIRDDFLQLVGSIDWVGCYSVASGRKRFTENGRFILLIIDWKRSIKPHKERERERRLGLVPREFDCEEEQWADYARQMRTYQLMLERNYRVLIDGQSHCVYVKDMSLVFVHPDQGDEPIVIRVPRNQKKLAEICQYRHRLLLEAKNKKQSPLLDALLH